VRPRLPEMLNGARTTDSGGGCLTSRGRDLSKRDRRAIGLGTRDAVEHATVPVVCRDWGSPDKGTRTALLERETRHGVGRCSRRSRRGQAHHRSLTTANDGPSASRGPSSDPLLPAQEVSVRRHDFQPEPPGHGLQGGNVADAPLPAGQQADGLGREQAGRRADCRWCGEAWFSRWVLMV
jgi:hypothetical protein